MGKEGRGEQQWVEATALCGGGNSGGCKPLRTELQTISISLQKTVQAETELKGTKIT